MRCRLTFNYFCLDGPPVIPSPLFDKFLFPLITDGVSSMCQVPALFGSESSGWFGGSVCSPSPATGLLEGGLYVCLLSGTGGELLEYLLDEGP